MTIPGEFVPIDPDAELGPAQVDRLLKRLYNELAFARIALRNAREKEIKDLEAYSAAKQPLLLDPDCPMPSRSAGVSKAQHDEWINVRIPHLWWAYQESKIDRMSAVDYSKQIAEQVKCVQSIGANARQAYDLSGRHS